MLLTTSVGSLPKPDYLVKARSQARKGGVDPAELKRLEEQSTRDWVARQEELGLDILVDGEQYRGDMVAYFAEQLDGFKPSRLVRSYGNRYYRKPIIVSKIRRRQPITVDWWRFAQALTTRPVKGMLTGPYTIMDWSFNEYYPSRRATALAVAEIIHGEARDLERAGAQYIQIDEPAISTRLDEIELAIEALGVVTKGLRAKTITHICYGNFQALSPKLNALPVDQIDLEFANRKFELLEAFKHLRLRKEVGLGVVDVHSHRIESREEVVANLKKALKVFKPEQIYVDPDCGLKTRTPEEALGKLRAVVEATRAVREELLN
ncbi:MAG TPA: methionine synthase [Candidatus Omnitrophica bacterium]|nr:MAG: methionine synthase [Omnitrophica WOR_2 bacterium GWA2_63_20]OGX16109.1 MAG: methionine synthase [Omnitrophica WOR_2 bacterium GWF2_63_9]OGX33389.1 MAG: methionine synthase [Omnitrophica WOR_2 bacterium RIFCSPHIGHO2_12_FULL_64_13]OGX34820.1 MAG: methionine synthase [Omnitrophica WOR_2 bacterium RIFCSPHIGHO2_02_FULL_63_39]OGX45899.1 MAG: methionine synthase [Omnitrophica WOR_2 bacterium RIFCSPLOWO2_02_FULL_63_16]OGX48584.1 MAG: methionine synthase [Omnitrophica WOR_2 bacterium RIFCSPLOW